MNKFTQALLIILSLFIVSFAQPDWSVGCCILTSSLGYALFWRANLEFKKRKSRFIGAVIWFAIILTTHLNWFLSDRYVGFYIYPFLIMLALFFGIQFAFISLWITPTRQMGVVEMLGLSGGWMLCEWGRLFVLSGFTFDPIGLSLTATHQGMQMASIIGIYGLSFWIIFTNLLALRLFFCRSWAGYAIWGFVAATPYLFGFVQIAIHDLLMKNDPTSPLKALLVQTALTPEQKQPLNGSQGFSVFQQWERVLSMLAPYIKMEPELIVFSEGHVPYGISNEIFPLNHAQHAFEKWFQYRPPCSAERHTFVSNRFWAQTIADASGADVVVGLEDAVREAQKVYFYNAAFLFRPFSQEIVSYHKRILVPMGEYIPFNWCKKILSKYGIMDSYCSGKKPAVFQMKRAAAALSICYEETYGHLMLESLKYNPALHINLSNDVWYPRSRLPMIHFLHGRLRAVEEGIPELRSCNTGVTCAIDALGRVVDQLPYETAKKAGEPGILWVHLPLYHYQTFYSLWGDCPLVYFSSILFSWLCVSRWLQRKQFIVNGLDIYPLRKNCT